MKDKNISFIDIREYKDYKTILNPGKTVRVFIFELKNLIHLTKNIDFDTSGLYILTNEDGQHYVGESSSLPTRMKDHRAKKVYDKAIVFSRTTHPLEKAELHFLEIHFMKILREKNMSLGNSSEGFRHNLSHARIEDVQYVLNEIEGLLHYDQIAENLNRKQIETAEGQEETEKQSILPDFSSVLIKRLSQTTVFDTIDAISKLNLPVYNMDINLSSLSKTAEVLGKAANNSLNQRGSEPEISKEEDDLSDESDKDEEDSQE